MASADAASATSCFHRGVPEPPPHASCPLAPLPPSLLPLSSPNTLPLLCFPPRTEPPPPTRATVATGHPTAPRRLPELRRSSLYLLNEPRGPRRAATPPSMSSSTSGPSAIFVKFVGSGASPSSRGHRRNPWELHSVSPPSFCSSPCRSTPATFPSTAVRHGRVALLTRAPLLEPVAPARFWWPADAVWTISFSPSAPQPNPAHGRTPAAASGSTPANPGHPRTSRWSP